MACVQPRAVKKSKKTDAMKAMLVRNDHFSEEFAAFRPALEEKLSEFSADKTYVATARYIFAEQAFCKETSKRLKPTLSPPANSTIESRENSAGHAYYVVCVDLYAMGRIRKGDFSDAAQKFAFCSRAAVNFALPTAFCSRVNS